MTSDTFPLTNLQNKIRTLLYENNAYKLYITNLEKAFITLESDYSSIKYQYELIKSKESYYDNLESDINSKNNKISTLEKEILIQKFKYKKYISEKEKNYEKEVEEAKRLGGLIKTKINNSEKIEKLNELLFLKVQKLENEIEIIKKNVKIQMEEKERDFDERLKDMKSKMLDFIKEVERETYDKDFKLKEKINLIHKSSLLNELEFQSLQMEDLLKQREDLDKKIKEMKNDIEIHKKVEEILSQKNKRYTDMIRHLSIKVNENKIKKNYENFSDVSYNFSEKNIFNSKMNKEKKLNFDKLLNRTLFHNENNNNNPKDNKMNNKRNINLINESQKSNFSVDNLSMSNPLNYKFNSNININNNKLNITSFQKELIKRLKNLEDYKSKNERYKTKLEFINNKYYNIIKIFDEALEKIYTSEMNKINEIFIDIEDLKKCNFNKLTPEQKYSIVTLIIQYLLPLVNKDNLPDNLKNNLKKISIKVYFKEYNNSFSSSNSMNTAINGKIYNNCKTPKIKKIVEFVNGTQISEKSRSPKPIIHNLDIEGYMSNNMSNNNYEYYSPIIQNKTHYNLKDHLVKGFPKIYHYPEICYIKSMKKE